MPTDPTEALRVAIVAALNANGGPGAPVYDRVPDNTPPPAVILDTVDLNEGETRTGGPHVVFFEVVTVMRGRSKVAVDRIMAAIFDRLELVQLSPAGVSVTQPRLQNSRLDSVDNEGLTHVGRQLFRMKTL